MDAPRQLPQVVQGAGEAVGDPVQLPPELGLGGRHGRLRGPQVKHQGDQPLLGAVVQVALDPPAGLVAGGHDPGPRGRQLLAALLQEPAMVLKLRSSTPISPTSSAMRTPRSPPASRSAMAAARRTGWTMARVR